jgi:hypothetical protein
MELLTVGAAIVLMGDTAGEECDLALRNQVPVNTQCNSLCVLAAMRGASPPLFLGYSVCQRFVLSTGSDQRAVALSVWRKLLLKDTPFLETPDFSCPVGGRAALVKAGTCCL